MESCVGPTLGATIILASQGENLGSAAVIMAIFGIGALVILGTLSHQAMLRFKSWGWILVQPCSSISKLQRL